MTGSIPGSTLASRARWIELDEIDSTSSEAMRRAAAGERGVLYVRADRQTAGRGRSGRAWDTLAGNLALSRLSMLTCPPAAVPQLALVAGVGVHRAIAELLGTAAAASELRLKWPNDVLLAGAKVAGILVEASTFAAERVAVIGVGVNLLHAPELPGRATATLAGHTDQSLDARRVGMLVGDHIEQAIALWDDGRGFAAIRAAWHSASLPTGTRLSVNTGSGLATGAFAGLDDSGALLLDTGDGARQSFSFGDVALIAG